VISIVACCQSVKLSALAAWAFWLQQCDSGLHCNHFIFSRIQLQKKTLRRTRIDKQMNDSLQDANTSNTGISLTFYWFIVSCDSVNAQIQYKVTSSKKTK